MTRPGIEPRSPGPLANTLTARPMSGILSIIQGIIYWLFHNFSVILVRISKLYFMSMCNFLNSICNSLNMLKTIRFLSMQILIECS